MKTTLDDAHLTVRLLGAVLAFELSKDMISAGLWMLQSESTMGRIARMSSSPGIFACSWMVLAGLVVPYLVMQVTGFGFTHQARIKRLACWAILTSGVFWVYMGYLSKNLDYTYVTEIFLMHGVTCIAMAAILANGLNTMQRLSQDEQA